MFRIIQTDLDNRNIKCFVQSANFDQFNNDYLRCWLLFGSSYHAYGKSRILLAKDGSECLGGLVVSLNPRIACHSRISNFHSLWLRDNLDQDEKVNISNQLLEHSERIARKWGAERMIGPLSCNTWHNRYRVIFEKKPLSSSIPMFPGEVVEDMANKHYYESAGYKVDQLYISSAVEPHLQDPGNYFEKSNIYKLKILNQDEIITVGQKILPALRGMFRNNYLFSDIDVEEFIAIQNINHGIKNNTKLYMAISEINDAIASFLLKYSYISDGQVFHVIKTLGTSPAFKGQRLGRKLLQYACSDIPNTDTNKIIYALMMHGGTSEKISQDHMGEIFRTYALYGKDLL